MEMKRIFGLSLCALCLGTTVWAGNYVLTSPGKTLKVNINVGNTVSYSGFSSGQDADEK